MSVSFIMLSSSIEKPRKCTLPYQTIVLSMMAQQWERVLFVFIVIPRDFRKLVCSSDGLDKTIILIPFASRSLKRWVSLFC